jgi:ligand-binding sensor domain-containing protein/serine phosphatase RsbU (regulator of sigma subunit)
MNRLLLRFNIFILVLLSLLSRDSATLMALDPEKALTQYSVQKWDMESGLPGNSVFAILQTQDGYLWLGTKNGLVRFDGLNFEFFTQLTVPSLKDNNIRALYEDHDRTLWIGAKSGGLTRYKEGEFTTYSTENHKALIWISSIAEDRWGNLWIGSPKNGLTRLNSSGFTTYTTRQGLPDNQVRSIYRDGNGDLWVSTYGGIVKLLKPGIFQPPAPRLQLSHGNLETACLYEADTENLWIGTNGGLFRLKKGKLTAYGVEAGLPNKIITCLYRDRSNNLWIGTNGGGLARMSNGVLSTLPGDHELAGGYINSIYEDREGSLWVGTVKSGLHQFRDSKFTTYTSREGLAHNYIYCIHESSTGHLWIGTRGGLDRLKNGTATTVLTTGAGLLNKNVVCLLEDPPGCLWIGTYGGLHRFKDGKLANFTKKDGLSDNRVRCILRDRRGNTWLGTANGLNRLDNNTGKISIFTTNDGLSHNYIRYLFQDSMGNIWISTDTGLNCLRNGIITVYNQPAGFEKNPLQCAYEDKLGTLWFGTDSGLIRAKEKKTTRYTVQHGLVENHIYSILEDEKGYLWLAGTNGISRVRKKELEDFSMGKIQRVQPESYNEKDGMKSPWCIGAGCKTRDGRFWFPTIQGVTMIDPNHIMADPLPPSPVIETFIVDGEAIDTPALAKQKKILELDPGKKRLEFRYKGIGFVNPQEILFKIRLDGYDSDWLETGNERNTSYTNLRPGFYTFKVTSRNPGGEWNEERASFSFQLNPYFYQTTWFFVIASLAIIMMVFAAYRFRVRRLEARARKLETQVKARTLELENAHQELRVSKEIIEEKNRNTMASIRYAQKIQETLLPMKERMATHFKDSFVLYLPKDIVSGDFYWFDIIKGHYFIVLADCTGHGVPGALLSMIGYMMLNETLHGRQISNPAKTLARLHQGFRNVLKQEKVDTDTHDGMDVGLCRIDLQKGKITYAGARRPLYYVKDSKLFEIKGDRKSIGSRSREVKQVFTNHEIDIPGNDPNGLMLYLTTDGYTDQHNPGDEKYGSRRLKQFLRDHAHLSSARQQQTLIEELNKHRADEEQRDDVSIIGIRIISPAGGKPGREN